VSAAEGGVVRGGRVVIIGAGIIGLSIAHHLTTAGYRDVLVLDRGLPGEGATGYATGGIRRQFTARINVELVQRSIPMWENFTAITGAPLDFRRHGYLFLITDQAAVAEFTQAAAMQRELGVDVEVLRPDDIDEILPGTRISDVRAGVYSATDGSASPADAVVGFLRSARAGGAEMLSGCEFVGIRLGPNGSVRAVVTSDEEIAAETVVLAPGPWAREAAGRCGVDVPVEPHRRQAFSTAPTPQLHGGLPLAIDLASGAYLHPERSGAAVVGGNDRNVPASSAVGVDWSRVESLAAALTHRFPFLSDMQVARGWCGLREMTPDDLGIIGPIGGRPGLWVVAGFSGHGFMQAPAVGALTAQWLLHGAPELDLRPLRPDRFTSGYAPAAHGNAERAVF
jgi:sarcosine oxidase, subunit beta